MKCKALVSLAFVLTFLVAFSMAETAFGQTPAKGKWKEVARGGDAIWHQANYYYYQSFDNDGDGWILWNYTQSLDFQLWSQTINDNPSGIQSGWGGSIYHIKDFIIHNPSLNWTITFRFYIKFSTFLWICGPATVLMAIYNNTDASDWEFVHAPEDMRYNFATSSGSGDYWIWIWNNGTKICFRVSFKTGELTGGETVHSHTLTLEVPPEFFNGVKISQKVWKQGDSGRITGKLIYEEIYIGGPISEPENIQPMPSWLDKAIRFVIDLFYTLSKLVIDITPYAGILIGIWILSGVVKAAETGEFSAMWEPFMTLYSLFIGILGIVQKAVQTIANWIVKFLEWIGLVGVAA